MKPKYSNPQGKGLATISGFLQSLNKHAIIPPKDIQQISNELFTSLFILHSDFKFRPVIGNQYWLYQSNQKYKLSLIRPDEWKNHSFGNPIGCCELHPDMTWTLELSNQAQNDKNFMSVIERYKLEFERNLQAKEEIIDILPGYQQQLPFYQRVFVGALTHSLKKSMYKSGIATLSHQAAMKQLADKRSDGF